MYVVIITDETSHFQKRLVYGTFNSVEEIKDWIRGKFTNSSYTIDIHPLRKPEDEA